MKLTTIMLCMAVPFCANAATLGVTTDGPVSSGTGTFDYVAGLELSSFDILFATGPLTGSNAEVFFDPVGLLPSLVTIDGEISDIFASGFETDAIELLLEPFTVFPSGALMVLSGFGLGADPLAGLITAGDATYFDVDVAVQALTQIPVPPSLPLMMMGCAAIAAARRRSNAN